MNWWNYLLVLLAICIVIAVIISCCRKKKKIRVRQTTQLQDIPQFQPAPQTRTSLSQAQIHSTLYTIQMPPTYPSSKPIPYPTPQTLHPAVPPENMQYPVQSPNNPYYPQLELNADETPYVNNPNLVNQTPYVIQNLSQLKVVPPSAPVINEPVYVHNIH